MFGARDGLLGCLVAVAVGCVASETDEAEQRATSVVTETISRLIHAASPDAQLANIDLQNMLQKQQQQTLQMLSNISEMLHDTAMAETRKIG